MPQIHMQEILRIASNLCAKKSLRNASIFCKFCGVSCIYIRRIFQCFFLQENRQKIVWQFCIFFKLFREDFYGTVSILRCLSLAQSPLKDQNAPIWRIGNRGVKKRRKFDIFILGQRQYLHRV